MTEDINDPSCDICGKPATHLVRDLIDVSGPLDTIGIFEPANGLKFRARCDEHPTKSMIYNTSGEIVNADSDE